MKRKDGPKAKATARGKAKTSKGRAARKAHKARMAYKKALRAVVLDLFMPAVESVAAEFVQYGPKEAVSRIEKQEAETMARIQKEMAEAERGEQ
jgi:hypothetical protein